MFFLITVQVAVMLELVAVKLDMMVRRQCVVFGLEDKWQSVT